MSVALALASRPVLVQDAPPDGRPPVAVRRPERPVPRLGEAIGLPVATVVKMQIEAQNPGAAAFTILNNWESLDGFFASKPSELAAVESHLLQVMKNPVPMIAIAPTERGAWLTGEVVRQIGRGMPGIALLMLLASPNWRDFGAMPPAGLDDVHEHLFRALGGQYRALAGPEEGGAPGNDVLTASPWPLQFSGVKAQQELALAEDIDPSVHQWARDVLIPAWQRVTGETPTLQEVQAAGAIAILESGYGRWWKSPCNTARNWGAVQCSKLPVDGVCPCEGCLYEDHHADGTAFAVCFLAYATDEDGAADLIKHITLHRPKTRAALKTGDANKISAAMYDERYYGGFGATREERIEGHVKALTTRAKQIATALGEPLVVVRGGSDPVDTAGKSLGGAGGLVDTAGKVFMGAALGVIAVVVGREVYQRVRR